MEYETYREHLIDLNLTIDDLRRENQQMLRNWQRLDDYLQRMLKVTEGKYKIAIQDTIYMVNMLKEIKENNNE